MKFFIVSLPLGLFGRFNSKVTARPTYTIELEVSKILRVLSEACVMLQQSMLFVQ